MRAMKFILPFCLWALAACGVPSDEAAAPANDEATLDFADDGAMPAADLVFWGGSIHTANDNQPTVQAVAVQGGRIVFAGPQAGARIWIGPQTRTIDLNGGAMYPGFTDSHVHVLGVGARERTLNLDDVTSIADLQARIAAAAAELDPGSVLFGRGWIETHWPEGRFPNRHDLDVVAPDHVVILTRADGHASVANTLALQQAGIGLDSVAPDGGEILREADGEPDGMLIDAAQGAVRALVEQPTGDVRADIYAQGAQVMASRGWTGAHDMSVPYQDVEMIEGLAEAGRLPIRDYISINPDGYAWLATQTPRIAANGRVITRAVKMYMDGALGSRGAALLEPYSDRPESSGLLFPEGDEMLGVMTEALRSGVQINVHAIGDRGNRVLLDWVEEALAAVPPEERALPEHRWRDEHSQIINPDDIPRFAELGVIASMQPSHAIGDLYFAPARLGEVRLEGAYAWQSLLDAGAHITGGTDAPVEQGDPRIEFYAATARAALDGFQGDDWHPEEALSREDALKLFTAWPAYASFREDELGTIQEGRIADLTIFSADIMTIPEADILTVEPWMTVVDGEVAFEAPDAFHQSDEG
ncbi:amidohydrolase [uncultured Maricaulis sp.]|uniref:amidohydrolase n=1 Tax=uncultured Maricaulis sp. TaxID=174710 RepID=UPI0030DC6200|tara:strand:+ start:305749 stop:307512 length:1764 start_codon:yes stop_codon:yes gene_type:complete